MRIIVTGGSGFIGSALVMRLLEREENVVFNIDKMTYAANLSSLKHLQSHPRYQYFQQDIQDKDAVFLLLKAFQPDVVMHLAAESHVDRSIEDAGIFIQSNICGTFALLESVKAYWEPLEAAKKNKFRFIQVSTDEVYGSCKEGEVFFETSPYKPNSPYAASKASADFLVRAYLKTYALPCVFTHSVNNYGPRQHPEKLVPRMITRALRGKSLPLYGDGLHTRQWVYVEDHVDALIKVMLGGKIGQIYHISGEERSNIQLVLKLCSILDNLLERQQSTASCNICFCKERLGHDRGYRISSEKIRKELHWKPSISLDEGLRKTCEWYIENVHSWQTQPCQKEVISSKQTWKKELWLEGEKISTAATLLEKARS